MIYNRMIIRFLTLCCFLIVGISTFAQSPARKFNVTGAARGYFFGDRLDQNVAQEDTITIPRLNSGHVLADLGLNIRPNKSMEIQGMVRVRNDYGGFWGSGVTFDIRQLYVKGVIGNVVRYQLGDINYRMTKYTLWNNDQELLSLTPQAFRQQYDVLNYDHFYNNDHSWRQQGAAAEWALVFSKFVEELQFHTVATRVKASNNSSINDRIFAGANLQLVQSKYFNVGFNFVNLSDIDGTSRNTTLFRNPVTTYTAEGKWNNDQWAASSDIEWAHSKTFYVNDTEAPEWKGSAVDWRAKVKHEKTNFTLEARLAKVDAQFNSPGAQTKRINYGQLPTAYGRITNDQVVRNLSMMDLMRESNFYNLQLQNYLMAFAPKYDNITPYGDATPNRMGSVIKVGWQSQKKDVKVYIANTDMQEVRGEGTLTPRKFMRTEGGVEFLREKAFSSWQRRLAAQASFRNDQTTRGGTDVVPQVDLNTQVAAAGLEIEVLEKLDVMAGWQWIQYSGFDFVARKNTYGEIFNFNEYRVNGKENMMAIGLRYRFSENAFLTTQWNQYDINDATLNSTSYNVGQIMVLYQMNF